MFAFPTECIQNDKFILVNSGNVSLNILIYCMHQSFVYMNADYAGEYYGPGGTYEYYQGPPSSQAQTPADLGFVPSTVPAGTPLGAIDHHHTGHHCPGEMHCFSDTVPHHPVDSPSPDPNGPGSIHSISSEMCGPSTPFTTVSLNDNGYTNQLSQPSSEMSEGTAW